METKVETDPNADWSMDPALLAQIRAQIAEKEAKEKAKEAEKARKKVAKEQEKIAKSAAKNSLRAHTHSNSSSSIASPTFLRAKGGLESFLSRGRDNSTSSAASTEEGRGMQRRGSNDSNHSVRSRANMEHHGSVSSLHADANLPRESVLGPKLDEVPDIFTPCSSTKEIGYVYLPPQEVTLVKTALFNLLFCVLDIKPLEYESDVQAANGFSWDLTRQKPIMEHFQGKESIKLATVPALVFYLATAGVTTDHSFLTDFLRTYRYFASALDVSRMFITIYIRAQEIANDKISAGEGKEMKMTAEDMATQIKLRVLNLFKKWISDQAHDFEEDHLLSGILTTFLSTHVNYDSKRAPFAQNMMGQLSEISSNSAESPKPVGTTFLTKITGEADMFVHLKTLRTKTEKITLNRANSKQSIQSYKELIKTVGYQTDEDASSDRQEELHVGTTDSGNKEASPSSEPQTPREASSNRDSIVSTNNPLERATPGSKNQGALVGLRSLLYTNEHPHHSYTESGTTLPSIMDLEGDILGQQLAVIEQKLFKSIPLHDFFCQNWNDKTNPKSLGLKKLINWFNHVARGVACEVVRQEDTKLRVM
ncbi:MAG: hypothetical protein SGCHY_004893, partial [Lobulomycetales sp.]